MEYAVLLYGDEKEWERADTEARTKTFTDHAEFVRRWARPGAHRSALVRIASVRSDRRCDGTGGWAQMIRSSVPPATTGRVWLRSRLASQAHRPGRGLPAGRLRRSGASVASARRSSEPCWLTADRCSPSGDRRPAQGVRSPWSTTSSCPHAAARRGLHGRRDRQAVPGHRANDGCPADTGETQDRGVRHSLCAARDRAADRATRHRARRDLLDLHGGLPGDVTIPITAHRHVVAHRPP